MIFAGDRDDFAPAFWEALKGKPNAEVIVYPGATHGFAIPGRADVMGHHFIYGENATEDGQARIDAFITAPVAASPRT